MAAGRLLRVFPSACWRCHCRGPCRASFIRPSLQRGRTNVYTGVDESGRNPILFGDEVVALFRDRNNRNGIGFDFHFQTSLACDVTQCFAERNLVERYRDARFRRRDRRCRNHSRGCDRSRRNRCRHPARRSGFWGDRAGRAGRRLSGLDRIWRRSDLAERGQSQNNVDAFLFIRIRVVGCSLLPEKIDRLSNACVPKFNSRYDDRI